MFGRFFKIDESAFSIAPNPKYLYLSKQHEEALAHLVYGITRKGGFVLLTGEIGTGKTTICRCIFEQLPENTDIAFVINPKFSPLELLASICDELHISYSTFHPNVKDYVKKLFDYLVDAHAEGRNTVLVIDEAQNLSVDALEHIRALTNIETNEQKLLQIILIGQPELRNTLAKPELEQVNQRITARFHIGPLNKQETSQYINHRLSVAGATQPIFSSSNIKQIHRLAKGIPRLINILCDRVLLGAYTLRQRKISSAIIKQSAAEVFDYVDQNNNLLPKSIAASVIAMLVSGAVVFAYQTTRSELLEEPVLHKEISITSSSSDVKTNIEESKIIAKASFEDVNSLEDDEYLGETVNKELISIEKAGQQSEVASDLNMSIATQKPLSQPSSRVQAFRDLFRLWGVDYTAFEKNPCQVALDYQLNCYQNKGDVADLIKLNRPAILKSHTNHFNPSFIVLVAVEEGQVIVSDKGNFHLVSIGEIEENWSGEFEILWQPLYPNVHHIVPGQKSDAVTALEKRLANLVGRSPVTPDPFIYYSELVDEVKEFQLTQNIISDGIVGPVTQIHINSAEQIDVPYLTK